MRMAAKKDANQDVIVSALRKLGAVVEILNNADLPDLLVGYKGATILMEVKDGSRKPSARRLRPGQQRFHDRWNAGGGGPLFKVETIADAIRALGVTVA